MNIRVQQTSADVVLPLRTRYREESHHQIVHDSIHRRPGWTETYIIQVDAEDVAFGTVALGGPWTDKPTIYEFYVVPPFRFRAFALFEAFLAASNARFFEVQTSDVLLTVMLHVYGRDVASEKIVFSDQVTTALVVPGATVVLRTSEAELRASIEQRQGGGEWDLRVAGESVGSGGVLFHYNRPYGDVYMEILGPFRKRGLGAFLVQELKRECYRLGAVPAARCSPDNTASRMTLQRAGLVPFAHILTASITNT